MMWSSLSCGLVMSSGIQPADWLHHVSCLCSWGFANYAMKKKKPPTRYFGPNIDLFRTTPEPSLISFQEEAVQHLPSSPMPHGSVGFCQPPSLSDCFILNFLIRKKEVCWGEGGRTEGVNLEVSGLGGTVWSSNISRDEKSRWGNSGGI